MGFLRSILIACMLCFASLGQAQIHVVLDLDWTVVYPLENPADASSRVLWAQGKPYRLADGVEEIIQEMSSRGIQVSFFSGGERVRNLELLSQIQLPSGKSAQDVAYRILHQEDLTEVSQDQSLAFHQRYKKDLTKIDSDWQRVFLIDDARFTLPEHQSQLVWLGETYNYYDDYTKVPAVKQSYDPPSFQAWLAERQKLKSSLDRLIPVFEHAEDQVPSRFLLPLNHVGNCGIWFK